MTYEVLRPIGADRPMLPLGSAKLTSITAHPSWKGTRLLAGAAPAAAGKPEARCLSGKVDGRCAGVIVADPETAWSICRVAKLGALRRQPMATICAALLHAAQQNMTISARSREEALDPDRIVAARLFTQLLHRASRPLTAMELRAARGLLPALPQGWSDTLQIRLRPNLELVR